MVDYDPHAIETRWQDAWANAKIFEVAVDATRPKFYCLEMYPYPSSKLHIGHLRNYSIGDCLARFKRMNGFNVLYPMGYDAFGLPAENAAIQAGADPEQWTWSNINAIKGQQQRLGLSYDWRRQIQSITEDYYKWNQWMFLKMHEMGLVVREESYNNWCPDCNTVLANEQVVNGKCWRCNSTVTQQLMSQWFLKIRDYADELLAGLETLDWPEKVKTMQQNWIGRSEGTIITFTIKGTGEQVPIFTTRADTIFGVTFMTFAPEHPWVRKWVEGTEYQAKYEALLAEVLQEDRFQRTNVDHEKKGMFIGKHAINPVNGEEVPVFIGNFVIYEYGAGAVMAVPAHDQRDFEFAREFDLPVRVVIQPHDYEIDGAKMSRAFEQDGILANSGEFDGLENRRAIEQIGNMLQDRGLGGPVVNYKLRNWLISRQRYWGTPIPMIHCPSCGTVPVPLESLPVSLPKNVRFTGTGNPLETSPDFVNVACPRCKGKARRETDTMDTFVDSSWYFFRFTDPDSDTLPYRKDVLSYWGPVDQYIGGIEHAIMHLLYARFWTKVTRDMGLHGFDEPFKALLTQGMVNKENPFCEACNQFLPVGKYDAGSRTCKKCGAPYGMKSAKMSKSLGNTVDPQTIIDKHGADTARFFILATANPEKQLEWSDEGVEHAARLVRRAHATLNEPLVVPKTEPGIFDELMRYHIHATLKEVTGHYEKMSIRDALNAITRLVDLFRDYIDGGALATVHQECTRILTLMLAPAIPHACEETWRTLGNAGFISTAAWPAVDETCLDPELARTWDHYLAIREDVLSILKILKREPRASITLVVAAGWKHDVLQRTLAAVKQGKQQGDIIKDVMTIDGMKARGKLVSSMVGKIARESWNYEQHGAFTDQATEMAVMEKVRLLLSKKHAASIILVKEEASTEKKAELAMPGRPAIIID